MTTKEDYSFHIIYPDKSFGLTSLQKHSCDPSGQKTPSADLPSNLFPKTNQVFQKSTPLSSTANNLTSYTPF